MTAFDALAAAIRERLISGRPAPLPGLGTLVRQHVSARIEERPDGTRVLLPPGETIGLAATEDGHESLAAAFGRLQALPEAEADGAYARAMDQLEAHLAATGEVRLPGVGLLRRTSGGVVLGVEAGLLSAVNQAFEGLEPVGADPSPAPATPDDASEPLPEEAPADDFVDAPPVPEVEEPVEAEEPIEVPTASGTAEDADDAIDEAPAPVVDVVADAGSASEASAVGTEADEPPALQKDDEPLDADSETTDTDDEPGAPMPEAEAEAEDTDVAPDDEEPVVDASGPSIAVPFGAPSDEPVDVIPPTPLEADPTFDTPGSPEAETDDWASETWTAGTTAAPTPDLLGTRPQDLIEDADFEVLPAGPLPPQSEAVSPEAELDALFATPAAPPQIETVAPAAPADVAPPEVAEVPATEPASSNTAAWVVGLLVLALLAALAFWLWSSRSEPDAVPLEPVAETAASPPSASGEGDAPDAANPVASAEGEPADAAPEAGDTVDEADFGGDAEPQAPAAAAPAPAASAPTASGTAVSPPRLDGLDDGDRRSLAGPPIDPAMGGWTIVIASLRSEAAADEESALWAEAGYRTGVFPPSERGQTRYRVGVGQFASEALARRLRERLPPRAPADAWLLNLRSL